MHPVTVFIERFRAAVSVFIGPCCSSRIVFAQMCILLYCWANKMMMMMMACKTKVSNFYPMRKLLWGSTPVWPFLCIFMCDKQLDVSNKQFARKPPPLVFLLLLLLSLYFTDVCRASPVSQKFRLSALHSLMTSLTRYSRRHQHPCLPYWRM